MVRIWSATLLAFSVQAVAQTATPFVVGEWAGDCAGDYRIGYRIAPDGRLIGYTVNRGIAADFAAPKVLTEDAEFFTLDFGDGGAPIVWKKDGQTMRPWSQGEGGSVIRNGFREGSPTVTFNRCR